ncbi:MAG: hypothetical protein RIQ81_889 [Pseudomonadota bacterium]
MQGLMRNQIGKIAALWIVLVLWMPASQSLAVRPKVFLHLICEGGFDPSMVVDWKGASGVFAVEAGSAARVAASGFSHVSNPARSAVDAFFDQWGAKTSALNGIGFDPATGGDFARGLSNTNLVSLKNRKPRNWLAAYAQDIGKGRPVPVLAFPGTNASGDVEDESLIGRVPAQYLSTSPASPTLPVSVTDRIFRDLRKDFTALGVTMRSGSADQLDARVMDRQFRFQQVFAASIPGAWSGGYSAGDPLFVSQARAALRMFAQGKSLAAMIRVGGSMEFATRANHFTGQSALLQSLFSGLDKIVQDAYALGIQSELVVVVSGNTGLTPWLNSRSGKDPWPYGSILVWGDGIKMGKVGAFDDHGRGVKIDPRFGYTTGDLIRVTPANAWAAMLVLGGVDYRRWTSAQPISGILEGGR